MYYEYIENNILKVFFESREELNKFITTANLLKHDFNLEASFYKKFPEIKKELQKFQDDPFEYRFHRIAETKYVLYVGIKNRYKSEQRTNDRVMTEDALQYPYIPVTSF